VAVYHKHYPTIFSEKGGRAPPASPLDAGGALRHDLMKKIAKIAALFAADVAIVYLSNAAAFFVVTSIFKLNIAEALSVLAKPPTLLIIIGIKLVVFTGFLMYSTDVYRNLLLDAAGVAFANIIAAFVASFVYDVNILSNYSFFIIIFVIEAFFTVVIRFLVRGLGAEDYENAYGDMDFEDEDLDEYDDQDSIFNTVYDSIPLKKRIEDTAAMTETISNTAAIAQLSPNVDDLEPEETPFMFEEQFLEDIDLDDTAEITPIPMPPMPIEEIVQAPVEEPSQKEQAQRFFRRPSQNRIEQSVEYPAGDERINPFQTANAGTNTIPTPMPPTITQSSESHSPFHFPIHPAPNAAATSVAFIEHSQESILDMEMEPESSDINTEFGDSEPFGLSDTETGPLPKQEDEIEPSFGFGRQNSQKPFGEALKEDEESSRLRFTRKPAQPAIQEEALVVEDNQEEEGFFSEAGFGTSAAPLEHENETLMDTEHFKEMRLRLEIEEELKKTRELLQNKELDQEQERMRYESIQISLQNELVDARKDREESLNMLLGALEEKESRIASLEQQRAEEELQDRISREKSELEMIGALEDGGGAAPLDNYDATQSMERQEILDTILEDVRNLYTALNSRSKLLEEREQILFEKMAEFEQKEKVLTTEPAASSQQPSNAKPEFGIPDMPQKNQKPEFEMSDTIVHNDLARDLSRTIELIDNLSQAKPPMPARPMSQSSIAFVGPDEGSTATEEAPAQRQAVGIGSFEATNNQQQMEELKKNTLPLPIAQLKQHEQQFETGPIPQQNAKPVFATNQEQPAPSAPFAMGQPQQPKDDRLSAREKLANDAQELKRKTESELLGLEAGEQKQLGEENQQLSNKQRIAEQEQKAEEQRIAEEQEKLAEEQRIAMEQQLAEEEARLAEEQRIAEEQARLAEEQRIAEEQARLAEEHRMAEEQARLAEEQRLLELQARLAKEAEELKKLELEKERLAEEHRKLQEARAEQERLAKEAEEKRRIEEAQKEKERVAREAEEKRRIEEARAEQERLAKEAEEQRQIERAKAEQERLVKEKEAEAEKQRLAELAKEAEAEKQRLAELAKEAELERRRLAELEKQKEELERQRIAELERQKAELERQRQAELEKQRLAEIEKQKLAEEKLQLEEEKERIAEEQRAQVKAQEEARKVAEKERRAEQERLRALEIEKQKEAAAAEEIRRKNELQQQMLQKQQEELEAQQQEIARLKEAQRKAELDMKAEYERRQKLEQEQQEAERQRAEALEIQKSREIERKAELEKQADQLRKQEEQRIADLKKELESQHQAELAKAQALAKAQELEEQKKREEDQRQKELKQLKEAQRRAQEEIEKQQEMLRQQQELLRIKEEEEQLQRDTTVKDKGEADSETEMPAAAGPAQEDVPSRQEQRQQPIFGFGTSRSPQIPLGQELGRQGIVQNVVPEQFTERSMQPIRINPQYSAPPVQQSAPPATPLPPSTGSSREPFERLRIKPDIFGEGTGQLPLLKSSRNEQSKAVSKFSIPTETVPKEPDKNEGTAEAKPAAESDFSKLQQENIPITVDELDSLSALLDDI